MQVDHNQSQILLKSSEKFGLLLAVNLDEVGSSVTIESENIGMATSSLLCMFVYIII